MPIKQPFLNNRLYQSLAEGQTVKNLDLKKKGKPNIFIGSSTESLHIAEQVKALFEEEFFEVDIWDEGVFGKEDEEGDSSGLSNAEQLKNFTDIYDYAIFIFVPEDEIVSKTRVTDQGDSLSDRSTRHNVVFEFGLFLGKIGAKKTYILSDKDTMPLLKISLRI